MSVSDPTETPGDRLRWMSVSVCCNGTEANAERSELLVRSVDHIADRLNSSVTYSHAAGVRIKATEAGAKQLANRWMVDLIDAGIVSQTVIGFVMQLLFRSSPQAWLLSELVKLALRWLQSCNNDRIGSIGGV